MSVHTVNPTSPGRRALVRVRYAHLHKGEPHGPLLAKKEAHSGRNNLGRITVRHQGGGHKQRYRLVDFKRVKDVVPAVVERIEYDPNRTAHIALLKHMDGARSYIIAAHGLAVGDQVSSGSAAPIKIGNCLPLKNIPVGSFIHSVELKPGKGAQLARSAGVSVQLVAREADVAILRLKSGEMREVLVECRATIGVVSNIENNLKSLGKAGAARWRGRRPTVRGVAMNPVDHPHGGGEGKTSGGRHPVSPWGQPTKGYKTRKNKRTERYILQDRRRK